VSDPRRPLYRDVQPVKEIVTFDEAMDAKVLLDETADDYAVAYAEVDFRQYTLRQIEALGAQLSDERAALAKQWDARTSAAYEKGIERLRHAQVEFKRLEAMRDGAKTKIELYRTIEASRRARDELEVRRLELELRREQLRDDRRRYDNSGAQSGTMDYRN